MTNPEDSLSVGGTIFLFVVILIVGAMIYYTFIPQGFDVSNIPDQERWNDLNSVAARDRFCQAQGYTEARIVEGSGRVEMDSAGSPYGYMILCKRNVPDNHIYDYSDYKKWLIQLEITNKT